MVDGLAEEARAGNGAHANLRREVLTELEVAVVAELRDFHHHVIGTLRYVVLKSDTIEPLAEQVALGGIEVEDLIVIAVVEVEGGDDGFLQGSGGTHGEEVVDLLDALGDLGRGDGVPQAPAGDGVRLGQRAATDGSFEHAGQRGHIDVLVGRVDDVLVYLVGDAVGVVLFAEVGDKGELLARKDLAAGVGRVAQDDGLGVVVAEGRLECLAVKVECGRVERHVDGLGTRKDRVGAVVLVERREDDDLIAGVRDRHHGGHHGLGGAAGDYDILVGVHRHAHKVLLFGGKRLAHGLGAPGDGGLVIERLGIGGDGAEAIEQLRRGIEVREALREIDSAVLIGDACHAADDRIGKSCRAVGEFFHDGPFEHLQWGKFTPMKPVGFARNGLEKLFG